MRRSCFLGMTVALSAGMVGHYFTIDLEEYFQVAAFKPFVPHSDWDRLESRVARQVAELLDLLGRHDARATFFTVGWLAERHPQLIRAIDRAGHEIASHSWDHARVTDQTPAQFRASIRRTKQFLESITASPVLGFRAPNYSIVPGTEWALDVLIEEGYQYDSSLFPVRRPGYGYASATPDPHWLARPAGRLREFPPATLRVGGLRLPAAGGAYFRLLPYALVRTALRQCEQRGVPGTFYIHPWEIDADQPRLAVPRLTRLRHYGGLSRTMPRLIRLLQEFRFTSIRDGAKLWTASVPEPEVA